ncbi:MAG: dynamin family protein [Saprospiraceae bacterium]|nr:dynamin family protein [Saprospiraceae bacterium]
MNQLLDQKVTVIRAKIDETVKDLHTLSIRIGNEELAETISDLRSRIQEPFLFVVVGEVKAGKSSFINALLDTGKEICRVAPMPMTDTVQQIIYGEKEEVIVVNSFLKKLLQPIDILKEIAIVDTPGTNTIVANHQVITERFIPASDLIVFVFESKNPYRQSAWDFFDFIHGDWQKKVIFVLQQKDLMNKSDLDININGVKEMAIKKGISSPIVFDVSAKMELEGDKAESGFIPLREYILHNITGGKAPLLKQINNVSTSLNIIERIDKGLVIRKNQLDADIFFRNDIRETLNKQEEKSKIQVDNLVNNLLSSYDHITLQTERELDHGLSFPILLKRSFTSIFNKNESAKEWLNGLAKHLDTELQNSLKAKLNDGVSDIADSIQQMAKIIDLKIRNSTTILKDDHDLFSEIAEKRSNVLRELQQTFSDFMNRSENFNDTNLFPDKSNVSPSVATGSGIAIVGLILAAVTKGAVLDVTGGLLTAVGLLFAGITVGIKRKKIIGGFQEEILKSRNKLQLEVEDKLKVYIHNIRKRIESNFSNFDAHLEQEQEQLSELNSTHKSIASKLETYAYELNALI